MPSKRRSPDKPVCFFGKLNLEFYNNDDEEFKIKALKSLAKEASKEFNISCLPVEEHSVENPEFGTLVVSLVAASHDAGKATLDKALKFFDEKAPARIIAEDFEKAEIS
jgi:uncharacterized protein YlxP (DUF503 family)